MNVSPIHDFSIHLSDAAQPEWRSSRHTRSRGYAIAGDGTLFEGQHLAAFVDGAAEEDIESELQGLNGAFAFIRVDEVDGKLTAATDRVRSFPLFFGERGGILFLSDDAEWVADRVGGKPVDGLLAAEFLLQGMVSGSDTLATDVHQLRAGEVLTVRNACLRTQRYYMYGGRLGTDPPPDSDGSADRAVRQQMIEEGISVVERAFRRMLESIGDRPVAVPLSGGMDSRLVAFMLKRLGASDVRCFSYGRPNSFEVQTSEAVADRLNFPWRMVSYTSRRWHHWYGSSGYQTYRRRASNLAAIEHEQDWPAVMELKEEGWLPEDSVLIPGHSGDMVAGSHLPSEALEGGGQPDVVAWIWRRYFRLWPKEGLSPQLMAALKARIELVIRDMSEAQPRTPAEAAHLFDQYGWQERQAKMIVNSVRVYEHHGFAWRLPLWDAELMEFWPRVPVAERYGKRLYLDMLNAVMGGLARIPAMPPEQNRLRNQVERFLDYDLRRYGMYLGPYPALSAIRMRVPDLLRAEPSWLKELVRPLRHRPPQWISINGMIALVQWQDTVERLSAE